MEKQIYFRQPQKPRVAVTLAPHRWGPNGHLVVASADQSIWFALSGNIAALVVQLRGAAKQLEEMICTDTERGIVRGEIKPEPARQFNLITIEDLQGKSAAQQIELLIQRFSNIDLADPDLRLVEALKADYKTITGKAYVHQANGSQAAPQTVDQLSLDLEMIKDIAAELINDDGQPVWGAQSRIAEALALPSTGGVYRRRILDVVEALKGSDRKVR